MLKLSLLATVVASVPVFANPVAKDIEHLSVYASRQAKPVTQVNASVSLISRADIDLLQPKDLPALLQTLPGVQINRQGSRGQNVNIYIRGGNTKHTLVLIDGVRTGAAGAGYQDLAHIPVELIEKVELIRGSRAALYGSDAVAGVIAITTRQSQSTQLVARTGSHGLAEASLHGRVIMGETQVFGSTGYSRADGIHVMNDPKADPDNDGFTNRFVKAGGRQQFEQGWVEYSSHLVRGFNEYDSGAYVWHDQAKVTQDLHQIAAEYQQQLAGVQLEHRGHIALNNDKSTNFGNAIASSLFTTKRQELDYQLTSAFTPNLSLLSGVSVRNEDVKLSTVDQSRRTNSMFVGVVQQWNALQAEATVRNDHVTGYGDNNTYQWGLSYQLATPLQLRINQGSTFKVPTFNDLYYPFSSNPDLLPEQGISREVGLRFTPENAYRFSMEAVHFIRSLSNMIVWNNKARMPLNIETAELQGLEYMLSARTAGVDHQFSITYTDGDYQLADKGGALAVPYIPKQKYYYQASLEAGDWQFSGSALYRDAIVNKLTAVQQTGSVVLFGAGVQYHFSKTLNLRLNLENLLDRTYETTMGYHQPGREFSLSLQSLWF